jgi:hypothetical protein
MQPRCSINDKPVLTMHERSCVTESIIILLEIAAHQSDTSHRLRNSIISISTRSPSCYLHTLVTFCVIYSTAQGSSELKNQLLFASQFYLKFQFIISWLWLLFFWTSSVALVFSPLSLIWKKWKGSVWDNLAVYLSVHPPPLLIVVFLNHTFPEVVSISDISRTETYSVHRIWDSHSGGYEEFNLLGHNAVQSVSEEHFASVSWGAK